MGPGTGAAQLNLGVRRTRATRAWSAGIHPMDTGQASLFERNFSFLLVLINEFS